MRSLSIHIGKFSRILLIASVVIVSASSVSSPAVGMQSQAETVRFAVIGDFGDDTIEAIRVARMIREWSPEFIVTVGDNSYSDVGIDDGTGLLYSEYIGSYTGVYGSGSDINRFFPAPGNHDYSDGGGIEAYLDYFTLPGEGITSSGTSGNERYYDFTWGPVQFFALNSNNEEPDGDEDDSIQAEWLRRQLSASSSPWKIVYVHHPPFTSGTQHSPEDDMRWPFESWGVTALFAGHNHQYERILRDDNNDGFPMPYFVVGFSGHSRLDPFVDIELVEPGSAMRFYEDFGAVLVEASETSITFEAWTIDDDGQLIDSFTLRKPGSCVTTYNDLGWDTGQPSNNITTITSPSGASDLPSSGFLIDYDTGEPTSIELTVIGGYYSGTDSNHSQAGDAVMAGDAHSIFDGRVDPMGTFSYNDGEIDAILRFSGLDPARRYNITLYTHRNGAPNYDWERAALVTLMGARSFVNASSPGMDDRGEPLFSGLSDDSTRYAANNPDGRVVRFENIQSGIDGEFAIRIAWDGTLVMQDGVAVYSGKYANALMLQECR